MCSNLRPAQVVGDPTILVLVCKCQWLHFTSSKAPTAFKPLARCIFDLSKSMPLENNHRPTDFQNNNLNFSLPTVPWFLPSSPSLGSSPFCEWAPQPLWAPLASGHPVLSSPAFERQSSVLSLSPESFGNMRVALVMKGKCSSCYHIQYFGQFSGCLVTRVKPTTRWKNLKFISRDCLRLLRRHLPV